MSQGLRAVETSAKRESAFRLECVRRDMVMVVWLWLGWDGGWIWMWMCVAGNVLKTGYYYYITTVTYFSCAKDANHS